MCILRYMPEQASVRIDHRRRVVIKARRTLLEQRRHDHDSQFCGQRAQPLCSRSGNRLGQIEQAGIFFTAEILGAEQFLKADNLRSQPRGFADTDRGMIEICLRIGSARHLNQANPELFRRHSNYSRSILSALFLFDIDGTLVRRAGPHHRQALVDAVREVTGVTPQRKAFPSMECWIPTS